MTRNALRQQFGALLLTALASGCAGTTIRSGLAPGKVAAEFDHRWHPAFLFGALPLHSSYDLARVCPAGWSELRLSNDEFTVAASVATFFLYSPARITVVCAAKDPLHPPPLGRYLPPRVGAEP